MTDAPKRSAGGRRRFSVRKLAGLLHLWLGLASSLIVFIVAVTGCVYVFEKEIRSVVYRDRLYVPPVDAPPRPLPELWATAQAALGEEFPIRNVEIPGPRDRSYVFSALRYTDDAWTWYGEEVYSYHVYLNPYDGTVLKVEDTKFEFFNLVVWMHWSLLLSTRIGQPIVGTATLVFVAMLLTGLFLWWPRNRAALKARLKVSWQAKWKRLNWDLHSVPGFYAMLLALLIALTGLVWAFHWFEDATYFVATGGDSHPEYPRVVSDTSRTGEPAPLGRVVSRTRAEYPGFHAMTLTIPEEPRDPMTVYVRLDPQAHFRYAWLQLDRYTGDVLTRESFDTLDRGEKLRTLNYDLHTGSVLGLPGKVLAFLASLVCASLPVTGFLIWRGKRRKPAASPKSVSP